MEFYILNQNFHRDGVLDDYISGIWVERYGTSGDVNIIVDPTADMRALLAEGTRLSIDGSTEIMTIMSSLVEDGVLKVTGTTLDYILNDRVIYLTSQNVPKAWSISNSPGAVVRDVLNRFIINEAEPFLNNILDQAIPYFTLGSMDLDGGNPTIAVPFGSILSFIKQAAETYGFGYSVYLHSTTLPSTYSIRFKLWYGTDRTSSQSVNEVIQFSPNLDTLKDVKTLRSIATYKNAALAWATTLGQVEIDPGDGGGYFYNPMAVYATAPDAAKVGFDRRILYLEADDVVPQGFDINLAPAADIRKVQSALTQRAKDALANNNHIKVIDGQVILTDQLAFGQDYFLGDIVELEDEGIKQRARVTEYIRSKDKEGYKEYPTVAVV